MQHHSDSFLVSRYPPWLDANSSSLSPHDLARFTQQYKYVCEVCRLYDEEYSTNNDSNGSSNSNSDTGRSETKMRIMEVMQQMQDCGQPPQDLVRYGYRLFQYFNL